MSYADGLLSTGERIAHREKQHWFVFVWGAKLAVAAIILGLIFIILSQAITPDQRASFGTLMGVAAAALIIGGLLVLAWHILRYLNQEYVLTNRRVIQVQGVLNKTSMDSSLEKINDARLEQSVFGRMFGFGDLEILTAADTGVDRFNMIRNPIGFKKAMLDAKHEYERDVAGGSYAPSPPLRSEPIARPLAPAGPMTGAVSDDTVSASTPGRAANPALSPDELTRTLSSLADLRDRGAISAEEYERKKADLLSRL
ncbi:MAG TPA: PH domain-containing protein [Methylomirabilota bacterium]|nr:PH domain-containing protein [Methylomirabilota bacterium]